MVDTVSSSPIENSAAPFEQTSKRGVKANKLERSRRRAKLAELYARGKYQHEMAEILGCSQQQVSYDLKVLHRFWQQSAIFNINEAKLRELAKIDQLERTYYDAWERSTKTKETKSGKQKGSADPKNPKGLKVESAELSTKQETLIGDPRFLEGVQWCIKQRAELLGLNKASQDSAEGMQALAAAIASHYTDMTNATLGQDADGNAVSDSTQCPDATMDAAAGG